MRLPWGATLGKMALKIKVVKESDGSNISFREAFLRFSVDFVFAFLMIIGNIVALTSISSADYSQLTWTARAVRIEENTPGWASSVFILYQCWIWSELVVLLFNNRKRAIHDFIAGTVVIHEESQPTTDAPSRPVKTRMWNEPF